MRNKILSEHQQKTLTSLRPDNTDIDIAVIYTRVYGDPGTLSARDMQMKLAPVFRAINNKLKKTNRIEPGELKRTYRLNTNYKG
ncbi:hypothetical protein EKK58_09090 [Candidatus Dependentiae bacterium]|nr:MAG: hypothetical protein EKK58_09090 [Candidatus Dependentiae bacterium]